MTLSRQELAASFGALRRIAPRVPFWQLAAHRIPTLWSLYRGLLRNAGPQQEHLRWRIRMLFRQRKNCNSPSKTREYLGQAYRHIDAMKQWLDTFQHATQGNVHMQAVLARFNRMIAAKRERERWKTILQDELSWIERMRNRPILTGGLIRPTVHNRPLPRLSPQPLHIGAMIWKRRRSRTERLRRQRMLTGWHDDLCREHEFEAGLLRAGAEFEPVFADLPEWLHPIACQLQAIGDAYERDRERSLEPYSPALLKMVKKARREKIRNKTRERERERRGEVLAATVRRMRKGPPAHILARMSPEQRARDRVVRMASEGGYTGRVKRAMGMKLKDNDTWRREDGEEHEQAELERQEREFRKAQQQRLRAVKLRDPEVP